VWIQRVSMSADTVALLPPLLGDGQGRYRVHVVGNSGAGKSTLGKELAAILGLPYIGLDTYHFSPGWIETPAEQFREKVRIALNQDERGWVVDGNYTRLLGPIVQGEATDIIWLDPPFLLYFPRLCLRTVLRLLRLAAPCSPGCNERFSEVFFSSNSIVWWCITRHRVVQKKEAANLQMEGIHIGGKMRRIGGWAVGAELEEWKSNIRGMVTNQ